MKEDEVKIYLLFFMGDLYSYLIMDYYYREMRGQAVVTALEKSNGALRNFGAPLEGAVQSYISKKIQNSDLTEALNTLRNSILEILLLRFPHHLFLKNDGEFEPVDVEEYLPELISNVQTLFRNCFRTSSTNDPRMDSNARKQIWLDLKQKLDIKQGFYDAQIAAIAVTVEKNEKLSQCLNYIVAELTDWLANKDSIPETIDIESQAYCEFQKYNYFSTLFTKSGLSIYLLLNYCAVCAEKKVRAKQKNAG